MEQKAFLKSFVERIEVGDSEVKVIYTIPMLPDCPSTETVGVLPFIWLGSPNLSIDRTFRVIFEMPRPKRQQAIMRACKQHRNPIILAQEWQEALAKGEYASPADLARYIGVSRARVTQMLQLLKLAPEVLDAIADLGDPLSSPVVVERNLRPVVKLPLDEQRQLIPFLQQLFISYPRPITKS